MTTIELPIYGEPKYCEGCGHCCTDVQGFPPFREAEEFGTREEISGLSSRVKAEVLAMDGRSGRPNHACPWLDPVTRLCIHYEDRPDACREFLIGSGDCVAYRRKAGKRPHDPLEAGILPE